jgi:ferredoxin
MASSYQVRLFNKAEGIDQTVEVPIEGKVDQSEGSYLNEDQIAQGCALICISYPHSNCVFETHKEEEVLN